MIVYILGPNNATQFSNQSPSDSVCIEWPLDQITSEVTLKNTAISSEWRKGIIIIAEFRYFGKSAEYNSPEIKSYL